MYGDEINMFGKVRMGKPLGRRTGKLTNHTESLRLTASRSPGAIANFTEFHYRITVHPLE